MHAFLHVDADGALAAAAAVDERRAAGEPLGPLAGVPVAVKDVLATRGVPTTAGSKILEGWRPPYDATIVRAAARGRHGDPRQDQHGRVRDGLVHRVLGLRPDAQPVGPGPHPGRLAAAAARPRWPAYEAPLAIGTDTGGSIRQPGAVTGTVGAKPTYGGTSRYGLIAFSSSLDTPGPCARTVLDAALLHEVIAGHDPRDSTSIPQPVPPVVEAARRGAAGDLTGVRLGPGHASSPARAPSRA